MQRPALLVLAFLAASLQAACASGVSSPRGTCASNAPCAPKAAGAEASAVASAPPIAKVWVSRCGSCHVRVEPGTRDREQLESALRRHRTRVRMDETRWEAMVAFLAEPSQSPARAR